MTRDPGHGGPSAARAGAQDETKRSEALRLARLAAERAPENAFTLDTLGWVQFQIGSYAEAVRTLEKAHELAPKHGEIAYHLGLAYEKANKPEEAKTILKKALEAPDKEDWALEAGQALERMEKTGR